VDWVSIICLCHNQARFVEEAVASALAQTYAQTEIIIVDDGSTDGSKDVIEKLIKQHPQIQFVDLSQSLGNCAAFNRGWQHASGRYLIDLAADDILLPSRVEEGVYGLASKGAGVHFSDALMISEAGEPLYRHNERFRDPIPEGDLYTTLISQYLICPPTMMFRQEVMERLGGYDESLAYEDFDFWVRSSREFTYAYTDKVLVKKRQVKGSHSDTQHRLWNAHQKSTFRVCQKILAMNQTAGEYQALRKRCWHEIRECIKKGNLGLIPGYLLILTKCQV